MSTKINQSLIQKLNRTEKGGLFPAAGGSSFRREGKKEGVWGRNFCLPVLLSSFLLSFPMRRPKGGGRRSQERQGFVKFSWRLASMLLFEIGSNFVIKAAPFEKLRFLRRGRPRFLQLASHLLPREPEVRLRGAQSSVQWYDYFTIATEQPIFCISPKAKLLNFQKESDNFPREARLCPKAITT